MEQIESPCPICNQKYNFTDKVQMIIPCGDSMCLPCLGDSLKANSEKIACPVDFEVIILPKKFVEKVNQLILQKKEELPIFCVTHPDNLAEYYCPKEKVMICHECIFKDHAAHA